MHACDLFHGLTDRAVFVMLGALSEVEHLPQYQHLSTFDDRLHHLSTDMWRWCKEHNIPSSSLEELSLQKLGVDTLSLDFPLAYSKGWNNKVLRLCTHICTLTFIVVFLHACMRL